MDSLKLDFEKMCILDLLCRRHLGTPFPTDCLRIILEKSKVREPSQRKKKVRSRKRKRDVTEYNVRGAKVKRSKTKIRIKRAMRFNHWI